MADKFDLKRYLVENKLGSYSKATKLNEAVKNPRNPQEVAAAVKAQNPNIAHSWRDIATAAQPIMVASFQAQGLDQEKATTATRILLGGTHSTYRDFPQDLYDAVVGGGLEEKESPIDPEDPYGTGPMPHGMFEEGSSSAMKSLDRIEGALLNLKKNVATDSTIGTESKQGLLRAFEEMMEDLQTIGFELEVDNEPEYVSDYSERRASELEGDLYEYEKTNIGGGKYTNDQGETGYKRAVDKPKSNKIPYNKSTSDAIRQAAIKNKERVAALAASKQQP